MQSPDCSNLAASVADGVRAGERLAVSRAISLAEDSPRFAAELLSALGKPAKPSMRLGITGPPGVGKSTIVSGLIPFLVNAGLRAGALLVDPTSPLSGGAVLGDRIRLLESSQHDSVFVRSMASRGALGGISAATGAALRILEHWGADVVIIESVGVGQLGGDISSLADVVFLVLAPGAGDAIQTMKSGLLESADVFAVNKADLPGVPALIANLEADARLPDGSPPRIITLIAAESGGIPEFWHAFTDTRTALMEKGLWSERIRSRTIKELEFVFQSLLAEKVKRNKSFSAEFDKHCLKIINEDGNLYACALELLESMPEYGVKT